MTVMKSSYGDLIAKSTENHLHHLQTEAGRLDLQAAGDAAMKGWSLDPM